ncbi:hypothetical protein F2Q69_00041717 [Brassica cretica]|uniref:Uncharacterized protein n=1 Tax=Brassica cretica TaxID=69181 RepID=A0A8S9NEI7_BRACR|nr:hypothetical protein F2Q69_00041717 [Brassica cretica]
MLQTEVSTPYSTIDRRQLANYFHGRDEARHNQNSAIGRRQPTTLTYDEVSTRFHTKGEIDQLVEGIYRALETTEVRLDKRCDDIYFPMDLGISALTSKIEAIQGELVEIQSYIARRPEESASLDRSNNISPDIRRQTLVDDATNRGRLVQKVTSDMFDTHNHGEEISIDTYATVMRHQFNLESLGDRLQKIEDAITIMKDKWRRGDEAMRDFTGTWFNKRREEMETCFPTSVIKKKKRDPSRRLPSVSTDETLSTSIDIALPAATDINTLTSVDIHSGLEPKLTSNTKPDTTACLGAWYTWDQILQASLEGLLRCGLQYCRGDDSKFKIVTSKRVSLGELIYHGFDPLPPMVYRYLEQAPEMTIELDHRLILRNKYRSMFTSEHRSTAKRAEGAFGHS